MRFSCCFCERSPEFAVGRAMSMLLRGENTVQSRVHRYSLEAFEICITRGEGTRLTSGPEVYVAGGWTDQRVGGRLRLLRRKRRAVRLRAAVRQARRDHADRGSGRRHGGAEAEGALLALPFATAAASHHPRETAFFLRPKTWHPLCLCVSSLYMTLKIKTKRIVL